MAYLLKAGTVGSQQPTVTRQGPAKNRGVVFSVWSVTLVQHATIGLQHDFDGTGSTQKKKKLIISGNIYSMFLITPICEFIVKLLLP